MSLPTFNALSTVLYSRLSKTLLPGAIRTIECLFADDNDVYPPEEPLA